MTEQTKKKSNILTLNIEGYTGTFRCNQCRMTGFTSVVGVIIIWLCSNCQLGSGVEATRHFSIGGNVLYPICNSSNTNETRFHY